MTTLYAVVMAGGRGERFWPLSTSALPKPFIPLLGSTSLLQDTVARIEPLVPLERVMISIGAAHADIAREQLPAIPAQNFIVEPVGRDTSAAIGFAALHVEKRDPEGAMLVLPADHFVGDRTGYLETLRRGVESLPTSTGVVFGIAPTRPETGYGYVLAEKPQGAPSSASRGAGWPVVRFVEKPDPETALRFLASGDYFWNSGMFLWENRALLGLFERHMPELHAGLCALRPLIEAETGTESSRIGEIFSSLPRISIDFGIMEKTSGLTLIPAGFDWDDIGSWASLGRALPADNHGNIAEGPHVALDSNGCIIYAQNDTIAAFGVSDLIIVQACGKVLVCPKDKAADLKQLVKALGPQAG